MSVTEPAPAHRSLLGEVAIVLDPEGRVIRFNDACEKASGFSRTEVIGRAFVEVLVGEQDRAQVERVLRGLDAGRGTTTYEAALGRKDGTQVAMTWRASVASSGADAAFIILYGRMITPLTDHVLEHIRATRAQLTRELDNLLAFVPPQASTTPGVIDISALCAEIMRELTTVLRDRVFDVSIEPGLSIRGDEGLVRITLTSLLTNACKFSLSRARPRIEVFAETRLGERWICVRDNGIGFDAGRAHEMLESPGLGLAVVARIVRRMGGVIDATGEVDRGATFSFTLPA